MGKIILNGITYGGGNGGDSNQNIAENYDETATYAVEDYVIYNSLLYKCVTAVTTAETFDPTKWTHVVITDELGNGGGGGGSGDMNIKIYSMVGSARNVITENVSYEIL